MRMRIQPLKDGTTEIDVKLLPDGRTLIHWLQEVEDGPITIVGHKQLREMMGKSEVAKYMVACNPTQTTVSSQKRGNVRFMCMVTDNPKAATCPECLRLVGE